MGFAWAQKLATPRLKWLRNKNVWLSSCRGQNAIKTLNVQGVEFVILFWIKIFVMGLRIVIGWRLKWLSRKLNIKDPWMSSRPNFKAGSMIIKIFSTIWKKRPIFSAKPNIVKIPTMFAMRTPKPAEFWWPRKSVKKEWKNILKITLKKPWSINPGIFTEMDGGILPRLCSKSNMKKSMIEIWGLRPTNKRIRK